MNKIILLISLTLITFSNIYSQKRIKLNVENGVFTFPCKINGVNMKFIFDTGATNVTISMTEAKFLLKQGLLSKEDFLNNEKYTTANGDIIEGTVINLKTIEIDGYVLKNVRASIIHKQNAPLLFGQSAIKKLGNITLIGNELIINEAERSFSNNIESTFLKLNKEINSLKYVDSLMEVSYKIMLLEFNSLSFSLTGLNTIKKDTISEKLFILPLNNIGKIEKIALKNEETNQSINVVSINSKNNSYFNVDTEKDNLYPFIFNSNKPSDKFIIYLKKLIEINQKYVNNKVDSIYKEKIDNSIKEVKNIVEKWSYTGMGYDVEYNFEIDKKDVQGYVLKGYSNDLNKPKKTTFELPLKDIYGMKFVTKKEGTDSVTFMIFSTENESKSFLNNNRRASGFAILLNSKINNNNLKIDLLTRFRELISLDKEIRKLKNN